MSSYNENRKKGDIKDNVLDVLNEHNDIFWVLKSGMANYNSISRKIQEYIKNNYNYSPKINTISSILRKIYRNNQKNSENPFKNLKIDIITGLFLISCNFNDRYIQEYINNARAIRIMPEDDTMWIILSSTDRIQNENNIKKYGDYIEINIRLGKEEVNDDTIQSFLRTVAFNYIKISQFMISIDGFELFIEAKYLDNIIKLIEKIRAGTLF